MKVCKPLKVPILTRVFENQRQPHLHVCAILGFPLAQPRALLDEMSFWAAITPALGASMFDEGITKACGEVLVAGRWYAPGGKPVGASFVRVQVGSVEKRLAVHGDRHWLRGSPSEPRPMTEMPIDWAHAFGGPKFPRNLHGIGIDDVERDGETVRPLPNVESFGKPITSAGATPDPEGFLPMDLSFEQRRSRAGTFGPDYADRHAPGLPPDHHPTVFNLAPTDQWIGGAWRGDEKIVIENMSPTERRLESALPGLVTRAFVTHRTPDGDRFLEIALRCDTVWLFPSIGIGAVAFHGSLPVAQDDAADIAHLVVACEEPTAPRPLDHYRAALARRLDKDKGALGDLSDSDLMPDRAAGVAANMDFGPIGQWTRSAMIGAANSHRGAERARQRKRAELVAEGIDPGPLGLDVPIPPPDPPPPTDDLDALVKHLEETEARVAAEEAKLAQQGRDPVALRRSMRTDLGLDPDEPEELPPGGPPQVTAQDQMKTYSELAAAARARGTPDLDLEEKLSSPAFLAELVALERMTVDTYRENAHLMPAATPMSAVSCQLARVVVQAARDGDESLAERDFTGVDLHGADLSGMDFRRAFLEGADLRGADLRGARLEGAVLARADLTEAILDGASLAGANLGGAVLTRASFVDADLSRAILAGAVLGGAALARARLVGADLLDVAWKDVDLSGATLDRCTFVKSDLSGAKLVGASLVQVTLVECTLDGTDFTEANLHKATFVSCTGKRVLFTRARLDEAVLSHQNVLPDADFTDASANRCCLRTARLPRARFLRARMTMADLSECDVTGGHLDRAVLDRALLIRTQLKDASLRGVHLGDALLSKARIEGADFSGAQLTRADLTRATGDDETRFTEAVVHYTRFARDRGRPTGAGPS